MTEIALFLFNDSGTDTSSDCNLYELEYVDNFVF